MNNEEKLEFIRNGFLELVKNLDPVKKGLWGKMDAQQMVEHMTYSLKFANGRNIHAPIFDKEQLDKVRSFFLGEKTFRENTRNAMLPEEPNPHRNPTMKKAVNELKENIEEWIRVFQTGEHKTTTNPLAGDFTFEEWIQLLHKHAVHHAKQFGLIP